MDPSRWLALHRAPHRRLPGSQPPLEPALPRLPGASLTAKRPATPGLPSQWDLRPCRPPPSPQLQLPPSDWHPAARPQPAQRNSRKGEAAVDKVLALADQLRLLGPLGIDWRSAAGSAGSRFTSQLDEAFHRRAVSAANLPLLKTALSWLPSFLMASERSMFIPAHGADALVGQVYNRSSLDMFGEFLRSSTPRGRTKSGFLSAEYISGLVGAVRIFRSREARYDIAPESVNLNFPLALKDMRRDEEPSGSRARSIGIRAQHLESAAAAGFDRLSDSGAVNWAAATAALNLLLRGGEVGVPDNAMSIDLRRILTWGSIGWQEATQLCNEGRPWLIVWVVAIKDQTGKGRGYPCAVPRTHDGPFLSNAVDPYDAMAWAWWKRAGPVGSPFPVDAQGRPAADWQKLAPAPDRKAPFFAHASGDPFTTTHVRHLGKSIARAAGVPDTEVGAKCFRIGGATDQRDAGGEASKPVLKQRGRWDSDTWRIYQRPLVGEHLSVAAAATRARGADLEAICADFAQRATR